MEYTQNERIERIMKECLASDEKNPVKLFFSVAKLDFVRMHGPEHHFLDGACILTAFYNAGGEINLKEGLEKLSEESCKMPGAMCGYWGVCGAVTSIGAALSIIDKTGPLSGEDWGRHMQYTSAALSHLAATGGPRCCKRDAFFALEAAVEYINSHYAVKIE
ncbi:MAG: hypothetical protein IKL80_05160, partial [Clostridia bacterium]|nr:hypothetical protein [Clostridia bacterium]